MPTTYVADLVSSIVSAFTTACQSIGTGVVSLFKGIMIENIGTTAAPEYALSGVGQFVLVMAGVGFAFGLSKSLVNLIRNRG